MQKENNKTVGQIYRANLTQENCFNNNQRWKGKNKIIEKLNTFSSIIKIDKNFDLNVLYYEDRPATIINIFKIIQNTNSINHIKLPVFTEETKYDDVIKEISNKFDILLKIENKKTLKKWDSINFNGKNIVLQRHLESESLFFSLDNINVVNEFKYQKAFRYIFGALIKKYGIECFSKNSSFQYSLEIFNEMNHEEEIETNIQLEKYDYPNEQDILKDVEEKYIYYKKSFDSIEEYMKGNINDIDNILEYDSVFDCEKKQKSIEIFKVFKKLIKYEFNISDFFPHVDFIDFEYHPVTPEDYCMIVGTFEDRVFENYEDTLNDNYANTGAIPLTITKEFGLKEINSNLEKEEGLLLLIKLKNLMMNLNF